MVIVFYSFIKAKLDDLYDELQRELQNQRNWVNDMETTLRNQQPISDEESKIRKQLETQKVLY